MGEKYFLDRCPLCGGEVFFRHTVIVCKKCELRLIRNHRHNTKKLTAEIWNNRTTGIFDCYMCGDYWKIESKGRTHNICGLLDRKVDGRGIPPWCPLPDVKGDSDTLGDIVV